MVAKKLTKYKPRFVKASQYTIPRTRKYKMEMIPTAPMCLSNSGPNFPVGMVAEFVISGFSLLSTFPQKFNQRFTMRITSHEIQDYFYHWTVFAFSKF